MKKSDIKTGMLVQTRNGDWHMTMIDTLPGYRDRTNYLIDLLAPGTYLSLDEYPDTLLHAREEFDIIKVARVLYAGDILKALKMGEKIEEIKGFKIIWERQEDSTEELQVITKEA